VLLVLGWMTGAYREDLIFTCMYLINVGQIDFVNLIVFDPFFYFLPALHVASAGLEPDFSFSYFETVR
jgi:hypothetical protein